MNPHRKKSMGVRSGDLAGQAMLLSSTPPLPIQRCCRLEFSQSRTALAQCGGEPSFNKLVMQDGAIVMHIYAIWCVSTLG